MFSRVVKTFFRGSKRCTVNHPNRATILLVTCLDRNALVPLDIVRPNCTISSRIIFLRRLKYPSDTLFEQIPLAGFGWLSDGEPKRQERICGPVEKSCYKAMVLSKRQPVPFSRRTNIETQSQSSPVIGS